MIKLTPDLWIGNSADGGSFAAERVAGVLNVAQDLRGRYGWPAMEYKQVGLIDGPGNEPVGYCSAVLALVALTRRCSPVAVYDHDGGRALVVCAMYLNLMLGKHRPDPLSWSHWLTWEERLREIENGIPGVELPEPHPAHVEAFGRLPYGILEALI